MKRWGIGFVLVLLACLPVLLARSESPRLLQDSDTKKILSVIREERDPLGWFVHDWPLRNHFYRPVSTLSFELDNALHGSRPAGYGWTNAMLAVACILLLFWLARELTDSPVVATSSAVLFALWHVGWSIPVSGVAAAAVVAVAVLGFVRHGLRLGRWWAAPLVLMFLADELLPMASPELGVIGWLPGRTASVMAAFALASLACYTRYERLTASRSRPEPTPLDPPATRGTVIPTAAKPSAVLWAVASLPLLALALGSYEQAVMLPALLLCAAVGMRMKGYAVRWGWHVAYWAVLAGYLLLRSIIVPADTSGYQMQAFRAGSSGILMDIASYALPAGAMVPGWLSTLSVGWMIVLVPSFWATVSAAASNAAVAVNAWRERTLVLVPYAMSVLAFLPMAWLQRFEHYHYFPMAFRAMFVVGVGALAARLAVTALSPPALQAPARRDPAPGSLPRP